jgi:hypothetical protein
MPDQADHGLLFVDFQTILDNKYDLRYMKGLATKAKGYYLPVIDTNGDKFTTLLNSEEHDWFMKKFG